MRDEIKSVHLEQLLTRLRERHAVIGIIGLGYVGLPLALRYAAEGFHVLGSTSTPPRSTSSTGARAISPTSRGRQSLRRAPPGWSPAAIFHVWSKPMH